MIKEFHKVLIKSACIGSAFTALVSMQSATALAEGAHTHSLKVASSIAPISVLVQQIGGDAIDSHLILPANQSAHHTNLRPSQTRIIAESDVIFAIDPLVEGGLAKFMSEAPEKWVLFSHAMADHLTRREEEDGDHHDDHEGHDDQHDDHDDHEGHDHEGHDDHDGHDDHHDDHEGHEHEGHDDHHDEHDDHKGHDDHSGHAAHGGFYDYHLFFSPVKMRQMAAIITQELSVRLPDHAALFQANYDGVITMLDTASATLSAKLAATTPNHFIAMHDITLYLEQDFDLEAVGFVLGHDHGKPSAKKLRALQEAAKETGAKCVFYEPQIGKRLISQLAADMDLPIVTLDPIGIYIDEETTIDAYWRNVTASFESCFAH